MSTLSDDVHDSNDRARKGESDASGDGREEEHLSALALGHVAERRDDDDDPDEHGRRRRAERGEEEHPAPVSRRLHHVR